MVYNNNMATEEPESVIGNVKAKEISQNGVDTKLSSATYLCSNQYCHRRLSSVQQPGSKISSKTQVQLDGCPLVQTTADGKESNLSNHHVFEYNKKARTRNKRRKPCVIFPRFGKSSITVNSRPKCTIVQENYDKQLITGHKRNMKISGHSRLDRCTTVQTPSQGKPTNRYHVFSYKQVRRLDDVLHTVLTIAPRPISWDYILVHPTPVYMVTCKHCCSSQSCSQNGEQLGPAQCTQSVQQQPFSGCGCTHKNLDMSVTLPKGVRSKRERRQSFSETVQCMPILYVRMMQLIRTIRDRLLEEQIVVREIRLNGGAAGCVIENVNDDNYSDLDLIFSVDLSNSNTFAKIKSVMFSSIAQFLADTFASGKVVYNCTQPTCYPRPSSKADQQLKTDTRSRKNSEVICESQADVNHGSPSNLSAKSNHSKCPNTIFDFRIPTTDNQVISIPKETGAYLTDLTNKPEQHNNLQSGRDYAKTQFRNTIHPSTVDGTIAALSSTPCCSSCPPVASITCQTWSNVLRDESFVKHYIQKMIRIHKPTSKTADSWSLFTLGYRTSAGGKTVDIKFVDRMQRQFEFTVDSFQIVLDSLLTFHEISRQNMNENFYPTVVAESVSGCFSAALGHLQERLIVTPRPEEIRGGGLLKYCKLLVEGYRPSSDTDVLSMERYMCSRFFIDFPDIISQHHRLSYYLANHFEEDNMIKATYLQVYYGTNYFPKQLVILHNPTDCRSPTVTRANADALQSLPRSEAQSVSSSTDLHLSARPNGQMSDENITTDTHLTFGRLNEETNHPQNGPTDDPANVQYPPTERTTKSEKLYLHTESTCLLNKQQLSDVEELTDTELDRTPNALQSNQSTKVSDTKLCPSKTAYQLFEADANSSGELHVNTDPPMCVTSVPAGTETYSNNVYYIPQLVTYFPATEYSHPSNGNSLKYPDNCEFTDGSVPTADEYQIQSDLTLPHYHAGILLPPAEVAGTAEVNHYVGVPCPTNQYAYANYVPATGLLDPECMYTTGSPMYYLEQDPNYVLYTSPVLENSPAVLLAYPM
ncbi:hypothetical protein EG68_02682 [Paragonimus skrjabini miyazakii]|uniref:polynucleotide adenylyltransferase n=1 Tax=Paragonimus skrjabini miyazakii TaxID=59628 RepID=A0A8S9Z8P3_9TREM|nr:hypothetical protein EG68_02682 [Paragonimus skrjabini miyazakii]